MLASPVQWPSEAVLRWRGTLGGSAVSVAKAEKWGAGSVVLERFGRGEGAGIVTVSLGLRGILLKRSSGTTPKSHWVGLIEGTTPEKPGR